MSKHDPIKAMYEVKREFGEHGGVCPSIERSSTFTVMDPAIMPDIFEGLRGPDKGGYFLYSRHFNPTVDVLARYLAAMEGSEAAQCTASGMSAVACTILQLCRHGDHIVSQPHHLRRHLGPVRRPVARHGHRDQLCESGQPQIL
jgi:methionine-gamma-lyase